MAALSKSPYRGTRDFFPHDMRLRNYIFSKMSEVSEIFSYEPYDGPLLEEVALYLAKSGEELINEQIYSFMDRGERHVAIRPEMTPTVARMVAQIHREVPKPIRWYAIPNLMRYEKPQKGRLREFWQYNADIFGAGIHGEVEIIQLCVTLLKSFGANHTHFAVHLNDRRIVDLVFKEFIQLNDEATHKLYKLVDRKNKMDADKFSAEVKAITQDDKKAEIFEEYANLTSVDSLKTFINKHSEADQDFFVFYDKLNKLGLGDYLVYDPSVVRGLDYYTGVVFEIFDLHPDNRRAIAGGGSYANLLQIFNEQPLEGVGVGLGEVPLTEFLKSHNLLPDVSKAHIDYLVSYSDEEAEDLAMKLSYALRAKGKKTELLFGTNKPKKVFNYSDKKKTGAIVFIGKDEVLSNSIKIKDLKTKEETVYNYDDFISSL
ncbi:MAG TPA: histidine--tRNA ligase [Bacteriovoracaceae bacterium]|nr:histidine--tRNA ligase [Bacteriovoracaceae bacterium]